MKELLEKILGQIKKTPSGVRAYEDLYHICLETLKTDIPLSVEYLKKLQRIYMNMYLWKNIYLQMVQKDNLIRIMICLSHFEEF